VTHSWPGFSFHHAPKHGGGTVARIAQERWGAVSRGGGHDRAIRHQGPGKHIATARDPWTWYCSWYLHARSGPDDQWDSLREIGQGSIEFRDVLYGCTHGIAAERAGVIIDGDPELFRASGRGLCTWLHRHLLCDDNDEWAVNVLLDTQHSITALAHLTDSDLSGCKPVNTREQRGEARWTDHRPYRDWYDDEMISWVAEADAEHIALFSWPPIGRSTEHFVVVRS